MTTSPLRVWKFKIFPSGRITLPLPVGASALNVDIQENQPVIWFALDPVAPVVDRRFFAVPTGEPSPVVDPKRYVGTFTLTNGYVGHVFEVTP